MSTGGDQEDGTSTCTRQVKKYTQNSKRMASLWTASQLLENCCAIAAAENQMKVWGCSPPQKMLKLWNRILLKKPRKTHKDFMKWPTPENLPIEDPRNPSRLCDAAEMNPPQLCLKLSQNPPICKG